MSLIIYEKEVDLINVHLTQIQDETNNFIIMSILVNYFFLQRYT